MRNLSQCVVHKLVVLVVASETSTLTTIYILQILPSVKNKSTMFNKYVDYGAEMLNSS